MDVEGGGRRLFEITDDGEGMTRDDAVLAFERHATSKISKAEDLAAIGTLGFAVKRWRLSRPSRASSW